MNGANMKIILTEITTTGNSIRISTQYFAAIQPLIMPTRRQCEFMRRERHLI